MRIRFLREQSLEPGVNQTLEQFLESVAEQIGRSWTVIEADFQEKWMVLDWLQEHLDEIGMPDWLDLENPDQETFRNEVRELLGGFFGVAKFMVPVGYSRIVMTEELDSPSIENSSHVVRYSSWNGAVYQDALMLLKADDEEDYIDAPVNIFDHYEQGRLTRSFMQANSHYCLTITRDLFEDPELIKISDANKIQALGDFIVGNMLSHSAAIALYDNSMGAFTEKEWDWMNSLARYSSAKFRGLDEAETARLQSLLSEHKFTFRLIESLLTEGKPRWLAIFLLSIWDRDDMPMDDLVIETLDHLAAVEAGLGHIQKKLGDRKNDINLDDLDSINRINEKLNTVADFSEKDSLKEFLRDASKVLSQIYA